MHHVLYFVTRRPWWRQSLLAVASFGLIFPSSGVRAEQAKTDRQSSASFKQRAMSAAEQLRAYQHRMSSLKKDALRGVSTARREVEIKIDQEAKTSSTIFYFNNFESGVNGWTTQAYTGSDIWIQATLHASSPTHSWWPGIALQSNYDNGTRINDALISPAISLVGAVGPIRLMFAEDFVTERGWDYCMVDVSSNGGTTWTPLRGSYGSAPTGDTEGWQITTLDLTAYAGLSVNIRFYFDTGDANFNDFPGWFVDDVVIFDQGGTITGKKFFDVNNNGVKDIGEGGVKEWLITATGPVTITTRTNYRGRYWLTLPLGSYAVTETFQPNWTQKYPLSGRWNIDLTTPDTLVDSIHFGNYTQASFIKGTKFHDLNRNGTHDAGDTVVGEWKIVLADTNGNEIAFDRTDSTGMYEIYVFQPGRYIVREVDKQRWVQTYPAGEIYTIDIPDLNTTVLGKDFGNYHSDSANTLLGQKFEDLNKNHIKDPHEPGVSGFKIRLSGTKGRIATTDTNGYYEFHGLPEGNYNVKEIPQIGWWQSSPDTYYSVHCYQGEFIDTLDFGNYQIISGSIAGLKFEDVDHSGTKDAGEGGLSGWHILVNGVTYFGSSVNQSTITDGTGNYSFPGLWPGRYTVSEVWRTGWTQTYPPSLGVHHIDLGVEENRADVNFGNIDSALAIGSYRTFTSESLGFAVNPTGKHKPIPNSPDKDEFSVTFQNTFPDSITKVKVHFTYPYIPGTLTATHGGVITPIGAKNKVIEVTLSLKMASGEEVAVAGFSPKPRPQGVAKWFFFFGTDSFKAGGPGGPVTNSFRHPMPNAVNFLEMIAAGLKVGMGGPHSVVHQTYKDIVKSLFEKPDRKHFGNPKCLDNFSGTKPRSIKRQQKYLTPTKHNNRLFAEAVALQANIRGSDNGYSPPGFGNLIFDDGSGAANPLNGLPIRTIAAVLDSFMSSPVDTGPNIHGCQMPSSFGVMTAKALYDYVRMIDSAFAGPLDTISFATGLMFKGVRQISEVPFLRYDPVMAFRTIRTLPPNGGYVPEEYTLYQNYPNPFNPTTIISFMLSQESFVTLKIYNMLGQEVATLLSREAMDGSQEIDFDANNLPSGVYFYHLVAEGIPDEEGDALQTFTAVKKMLLLK